MDIHELVEWHVGKRSKERIFPGRKSLIEGELNKSGLKDQREGSYRESKIWNIRLKPTCRGPEIKGEKSVVYDQVPLAIFEGHQAEGDLSE